MKKLFLFPLLLLSIVSFAQNEIQISVKNNRLFSLIRFAESLAGGMNTSGNMRTLYEMSEGNKKRVDSLSQAYLQLDKFAQFEFSGYPKGRLANYGTNWNTFIVLAANTETFEELKAKLAGTMPNETLEAIGFILKQLDPVFEQLIWKKTEALRAKQCQGLTDFIASKKMMQHFAKIRKFYGAVWANNMPYTVLLNPLPSLKRGFTNQATVIGNVVIVDTDVESEDYLVGATIMFHEMCHSMSIQQRKQLQNDIEKWFSETASTNKKLGYNLMEEGLATPAGEWIYKQLTGEVEKGEWYNDNNINVFAKAFYAKVEAYINAGKTVDKAFVEDYMKVFDEQFPEASIDYISLFRSALFWTDAEQYHDVVFAFNKQFNSTSSMAATPILGDAATLEMAKSGTYLNVIVVTKEHKQTLKFLGQNYAPLQKQKFDAKKQFIYTDSANGIATILVNIHDIKNIEKVVGQLVKAKKMDLKNKFWYFN